MDCESYRISCQLEQIVAQMQGFDLNAFIATVIATLVGAAVAAGVSIELYRREVRSRRRGEIDDAVAHLIQTVQAYSQDYRKFTRALRDEAEQSPLAIREGWTARVIVPDEPDRQGIDAAVEMLVVLTEGEERAVASRCRQVLYELNFLADADAQRIEYAAVRRVLVAWRANKTSTEQTLANLDIIDERRHIIEKGLSTPLPEAPERYERQERPTVGDEVTTTTA